MSRADVIGAALAFGAHPAMQKIAARQRQIDERAARLMLNQGLPADVAHRVALFTLSTWAQRWPVRSHDLGEAQAYALAKWCKARERYDVNDMHEWFDATEDAVWLRARIARW